MVVVSVLLMCLAMSWLTRAFIRLMFSSSQREFGLPLDSTHDSVCVCVISEGGRGGVGEERGMI